jgi:hypothetical protein
MASVISAHFYTHALLADFEPNRDQARVRVRDRVRYQLRGKQHDDLHQRRWQLGLEAPQGRASLPRRVWPPGDLKRELGYQRWTLRERADRPAGALATLRLCQDFG